MSGVRPPAELAWLTDVIGAAATLVLIEARGGTRVYVPHATRTDTPLVREIGLDAARKLADAFAGNVISVPVARAWRVRHYRAGGLSYAAIAHKLGCHEDTVWRLLRSTDKPEQFSLAV